MAFTWQDTLSGEYPAGGERPFVTTPRLDAARTWPTIQDATRAAERADIEAFEVFRVGPEPEPRKR